MINQINLGQAPATLIHENPSSCYLDSAFKKTDANGQGLPKTLCLVAKNQYRIYVTIDIYGEILFLSAIKCTNHNKTMQSLITFNLTQDGFSLPFTSISSPSHDASVMSLGYTSNINP